MSSPTTIMIARVARAAAATAVFAGISAIAAAHAQTITSARFVAPTVTLVATPAGTPAAVAAVATPVAPPVRPVPTEPMKPAALPPANTQTATAAISCSAPAEFSRLDRPLIATARRLASGQPLTIVAIGSSSTAGAGASSPAASYPSRLAAELKERFPGHDITVLNRGVNGEETDQMMTRFDADVFAAHPQLVLWQVGTNSVLRDHPLQPHSVQLHQGIDELKAAGADVVLIDPQYSPQVLAMSETPDMVEQIAVTAKEKNVDLFRRFAAMRNWHEVQHLAFDTFVSPDGLHMNDWGYACWAKLMAGAIAEAATRPVASAAVHISH
jgi:acyl-CoA thioesterase I